MTGRLIDVEFKCRCLEAPVNVFVTERAPGEDIISFIKRVEVAVAEYHATASPACRETSSEYVRLPVDPAGEIGRVYGGTA